MIKLFRSIFILILPFIIINFLYHNSSAWKNKYGLEKFKNVPEEIDLANLGSSHAVEGLEYNIPELKGYTCFNFGLHQQTLEYDWYIFKKYSSHFKKKSILIINLSPFETNGLTNYEDNRSSLYRYYLLLNKKCFKNFDYIEYIKIKFFPLLTLNNPLKDLAGVLFKKNNQKTEFTESIQPKTYKDNSAEERKKMLKPMLNGWKKLFPPSDEGYNYNSYYLGLILSECKKREITPVVITFPLTKDFYKFLEENQTYMTTEEFINKFSSEFGVVVYKDYSKLFSDRDELFYDSNHLNDSGSRIFTRYIWSDFVEKKKSVI